MLTAVFNSNLRNRHQSCYKKTFSLIVDTAQMETGDYETLFMLTTIIRSISSYRHGFILISGLKLNRAKVVPNVTSLVDEG